MLLRLIKKCIIIEGDIGNAPLSKCTDLGGNGFGILALIAVSEEIDGTVGALVGAARLGADRGVGESGGDIVVRCRELGKVGRISFH